MVDPTSQLNEDVDEATAPACAVCGAAIVDEPDHRVTTWVEDGTVETVHFCDDNCEGEWDSDVDR